MNLVMLLEMARSGFGDRVALTSGAESFTYAELFDAAGAAAAALRASGARHAALLDESSPALPVKPRPEVDIAISTRPAA